MTMFVKTAVPSEDEIRQLPTPKRVDRGIRLGRIIKRASEELEKLKVVFRQDADEQRKLSPNLSPVHFLGGIGTCKVTFKGDSLKAKKDGKPIELKDQLPPEVFYRLFDVETIASPVKDFKEKFTTLKPEHKALIMQHFCETPNAPAVEFSK